MNRKRGFVFLEFLLVLCITSMLLLLVATSIVRAFHGPLALSTWFLAGAAGFLFPVIALWLVSALVEVRMRRAVRREGHRKQRKTAEDAAKRVRSEDGKAARE
ncbi:MAG: hypothetical protein HQ581_28185 [Planctomycetes bacterium]|nr:hypothetical protein [Planctomycetota bacterium]